MNIYIAAQPIMQLVEYGIHLSVCADDPHLHIAYLPGDCIPR